MSSNIQLLEKTIERADFIDADSVNGTGRIKNLQMNTQMVPLILAGLKDQTRRLKTDIQVGDSIRVREAHFVSLTSDDFLYINEPGAKAPEGFKFMHGMFFKNTMARLYLFAYSVEREPLQSITEKDAFSGGAIQFETGFFKDFTNKARVFETAVESYASLWDSLNKKEGNSWADNPIVSVIRFKVITADGGITSFKNGR
jgi:hypothetical protein